MKKIFISIIFCLACFLITSCANQKLNTTGIYEKPETTNISLDITSEMPETTDDYIESHATSVDIENTLDSIVAANSDANPCMVHKIEFHSYPWNMIEYVGEENFYKWVEKAESVVNGNNNECRFPNANIYEFIKYFNYPKDVFIEQFNTDPWVSGDYNIDLLYSDDIDAIEKYYRYDESKEIERIKQSNFNLIKMNIILENSDKIGDEINWKNTSLVKLIKLAGLDISAVKQQATKSNELMSPDSKYQTKYNYNFNIISTKSADEIDKMIYEYTPFYLDCLICGEIPYDTPYDKQVAENKELFG